MDRATGLASLIRAVLSRTTTPAGKADHAAATLALWSMSAGYIRGVGFVPRNRLLRVLFSTAACLVCLALSTTLIAQHWIAP